MEWSDLTTEQKADIADAAWGEAKDEPEKLQASIQHYFIRGVAWGIKNLHPTKNAEAKSKLLDAIVNNEAEE